MREALRYQSCLEAVPGRLRAEVAAIFRVSRPRVTQLLNLLRLPGPVVSFLSDCDDPSLLRYFTERRLRELIRLGDDQGVITRFREMVKDAASSRQLSAVCVPQHQSTSPFRAVMRKTANRLNSPVGEGLAISAAVVS